MKKVERGRIRVFFAEFEGDDATIQEGLRSISLAVGKTFDARTQAVRMLSSGVVEKQDEEALVAPQEEDAFTHEESSPGLVKRSTRHSNRKPVRMSLVKDLDLRRTNGRSLREFFAEKKPKNHQQMITVFVYYLQKIAEVGGITPNHVFTCFKDVEVRSPGNLPQVVRNTANRRGWVDSSNQKNITITNHGENFVEHDLPSTKEKD